MERESSPRVGSKTTRRPFDFSTRLTSASAAVRLARQSADRETTASTDSEATALRLEVERLRGGEAPAAAGRQVRPLVHWDGG